MVCAKLKYGAFSNWNDWAFLKREIDQNGKDLLYVSEWIDRRKARLAWATVVMRASEELTGNDVGHLGTVPHWLKRSSSKSGAYTESSTEEELGIASCLVDDFEILSDTAKSHT